MKFRTALDLETYPLNISHHDRLFFIGSCFSEEIGHYFQQFRFKASINPFGILYHPLAIKKFVEIALDDKFDVEENAFHFNEMWSHFDAHSKLSKPDKTDLVDALQNARLQAKDNIQNASIIFITLGTAWSYRHLETNKIVANCHKLPQKHFEKKLLSPEVTYNALSDTVSQISKQNPNIKFVFTLSPVRHLKDGFINNQLSKSALHIAIQNIVKKYQNAFYFPSYELLLDDLRDYRYYKKDMLHPNDLALDYIWSQVSGAFFNDETKSIILQIEKINKRLKHRFFNPNTDASHEFHQNTQKLIQDLEAKTSIKLF